MSSEQRERDERVLAVLIGKDQQIESHVQTIAALQTRCEELVRERDDFESRTAQYQQKLAQIGNTPQQTEVSARAQETIQQLQAQLVDATTNSPRCHRASA